MPNIDATAAPAPQPVRLIIGAVAVTLLLASLGQTIVSTALPTIVSELGGLEHLTWVVTAYLLSSTVVAPIYGKLGDLYGRKIVLQAAILIFLLGATLSALASSMAFLIFARTVQGLGGGGLMVVAMTVVADVIPARERGKIQGIFGAVFGVSTIAGPLLGGFFVEHLGWQWIFLINLPLGVLALVVIAMALRTRPERISHKIDYTGFVLLTASLSSFVLATSIGGSIFPWLSSQVIGLVALSMAALLAFVAVEARVAEPVLPLKLFRNNTFVITNSVGFLVGMAMFGTITFVPLYLQVAKGVSPTESGLQMIPMMVGLILTSTLSGFFMSRTGRYKILPILSSLLLVGGLLLLGFMQLETPDWQVAIYMFLVGAGIGPVNSVGVTATQNAVEHEVVGVATASSSMFRQIGGAIGVSLFGALFAVSLAARLGGSLPEGGVSVAFSSEALAALPGPLREQMLEGFAAALHPVFFAGAAVGLVAFLLTLLLRELPLATSLRQEPVAELAAEEAATSSAVGGPAMPREL
jgi:EmrB/QacA subfamily drug resistance transporter